VGHWCFDRDNYQSKGNSFDSSRRHSLLYLYEDRRGISRRKPPMGNSAVTGKIKWLAISPFVRKILSFFSRSIPAPIRRLLWQARKDRLNRVKTERLSHSAFLTPVSAAYSFCIGGEVMQANGRSNS